MVLLGVVGDDVVDVEGVEGFEELILFGGIYGVDEGRFLVFDDVCVVAGALGEGDEFVEQSSVPVDGTDPENVGDDFSLR